MPDGIYYIIEETNGTTNGRMKMVEDIGMILMSRMDITAQTDFELEGHKFWEINIPNEELNNMDPFMRDAILEDRNNKKLKARADKLLFLTFGRNKKLQQIGE